MAEKNLYIGYNQEADELIITVNPKAKTVGYFIESGTAVLLGKKDFRPYGLSFLFLRDYFKKHRSAFAKIPFDGSVKLPVPLQKQIASASHK